MNNCPIDGLPSELLSQIFIALHEASLYARSIGDKSYGRVDYPVLLSGVCSRWRQFAISTPYLWSYIRFAAKENALQRLERMDCYLRRAQNTPLRICIGTYFCGWLRDEVDSSFEFLLRSSAPRLESLAISYWSPQFVRQAISALFSGSQTTSVAKLALFAYSIKDRHTLAGGEFLPQEYLDRLFEPLQSLHLDCVSPDWGRLACRNLVELRLRNLPTDGTPSVQQLVNLLRANPGLRFIEFVQFFRSAPPELNPQPIELPHLEELDLQMAPWFLEWFISSLVPGSQDLVVHLAPRWLRPDRPDVTDAFLEFSGRARIVSLHVSESCLLVHRLYDYLPLLRTLRLSSQVSLESVFTGLDEEAHPLPRLQTFEFLSCAHAGDGRCEPQAMRKLPSLNRIRFRHFDLYVDGDRIGSEGIVQWFKRGCGDDRVEVVESPELDFSTHGSPFR